MGDTEREPIELAHRLLDIVVLLPHLPLTFIGILDKCYEIVRDGSNRTVDSYSSTTGNDISNSGVFADDPSGYDSDTDDYGTWNYRALSPVQTDNEAFLDSDIEETPVTDDFLWHNSEEEDMIFGSRQATSARFWLRESFLDDKAEIFKARHGIL